MDHDVKKQGAICINVDWSQVLPKSMSSHAVQGGLHTDTAATSQTTNDEERDRMDRHNMEKVRWLSGASGLKQPLEKWISPLARPD